MKKSFLLVHVKTVKQQNNYLLLSKSPVQLSTMTIKMFSKPIFRLSMVILVNENILCAAPLMSNEMKWRSYARWSARKPSKVFSPDEISSGSIDSEEFSKSEYTGSRSLEKESYKHDSEKSKDASHRTKEVHSHENKDYVILDEHDFTFSKFMTYVGNRNMRRKHDLMMLEGKRLNLDAIHAGLIPKKIFFTQKSFLDGLSLPQNSKIPLFKMPYKTTKLWSKLDTPPGIIGFYGIPKEGDITTADTIPVKVLCDNIRDPGNMGSIIRVAASVGCTQILLMKGCTDPWDAKVLRSASGGHFHIPIKMDLTWREHSDFLQPSDLVFLADSDPKRIAPSTCNLPQHLYHDVNYSTAESVVVVIGGETEGLSNDAFKLASHHNGSRVYIPLSNCMESLNSGCALSVILFEIKKQLMMGENNFIVNENQKLSRTREVV